MTAAAPDQADYLLELPGPLVSARWLADHLGAENLLVLDATVLPVEPRGYVSGYDRYLFEGHVPGARFADLLTEFSDPHGRNPFTRPGVDRFGAAASALGIDDTIAVVVYDSAHGQWASRLWWLLRAFGHERAAVLDGGLSAWREAGLEVEREHREPRPRWFIAQERPELWADKSAVERIVDGTVDAALVCAVPAKEFSGETSPRSRAGHIPGSRSVPLSAVVDPNSRRFLDRAALRQRFAPVLDGRPVVLYCAAGVAATVDALALTLLGAPSVAVYDGSLNEWVADVDAPLVTG